MDGGTNLEGPVARICDSMEQHNRACSIGICHEHTFYFIHVRKGKNEAEVDIQDPMFTVQMDRSSGLRLGLKLDVQVSNRCMYIKEVIGGLALAWNQQNSSNKVKPGDRIVRVNSVSGNARALMEECKKCQALEIELFRGTAIPITPGLHVTVKTRFANLQTGLEGHVLKVDEDGDALMLINGIGSQWVNKKDYDKMTFEDTERFYLKRYCDFRDLDTALRAKLAVGDTRVKSLADMPGEERFGFRRQVANWGLGAFMMQRMDGLQRYLEVLLAQVTRLDLEPCIADFFGASRVPQVDAATRDILQQRLDKLIAKFHEDTGTQPGAQLRG